MDCLEKCNKKLGEVSLTTLTYSPILAISRLPYTLMRAGSAENVALLFFESGKFWQRSWDIYCIFPDARLSKNPIFLVPEQQINRLLDEIDEACNCIDDTLVDKMKRSGFIVSFPEEKPYQPQYVGSCNNKDEFDDVRMKVAGHARIHILQTESLSDNAGTKFKEAVESAVKATRRQPKNSKGKKKDQTQKKQTWDRQSKRTERYLGLRQRREKDLALENDESLSWSELQAAIAARDKAQELKPINIDIPAPHNFEGSVIFIAVDVESYEYNHNVITEIGFAILDTMEIKFIPPGERGKNWQSKIRARHIRINEHVGYQNSEFVSGCAERFEFGSSEFVDLADIPKFVADCFRPPYSADIGPEEASNLYPPAEKRNIVLVGHDANIDIRYLQKLGYNPHQLSNLLEVVDTATLDKVWKQHNQQRSLGNILYDLDMVSWHLHNAGNDAVYTLWAMIGVALCNADLRVARGSHMSSEALRFEVVKGNEDLADWRDFEDSDDPSQPHRNKGVIGW